MMRDAQTTFERIKKTIKIKNLSNKFYIEVDYIKDLERSINEHLLKKWIHYNLFPKNFNLYKNRLLNHMKQEIETVIKNSQIFKMLEYIKVTKRVNFTNIESVLQDKSLLIYSLDNNYISKEYLETTRELLIDKDFDKYSKDYDMFIKNQNMFKQKIDDILGY